MRLEEINPFARYIRYLKITDNSKYSEVLPIDCRLFYVIKGVGKIKADGEFLRLPQGSVLYINSFVPYTLLPSNVRYIAINFDFTSRFSSISAPIPPILESEKEDHKALEQIKFSDAACFNRFVLMENCFSLCDCFEAAEREFTEKAPYYKQKNSNQIIDILIGIFRKNEFKSSREKYFNATEIASYIEKNITDDLSNLKLAELFHFHPNYMSSRFAEYYGKTLHSYVLDMRIMKAIKLLEEGRCSISEIAARVGFADNNYFSRYFKKTMGVSPNAYLQQNKTPKSKD